MGDPRVELLERLYDAWNRDDFDGVRAHVHSDVEWHSSGVFPGLDPVYRGPDGVRDWWRTLRESFGEFRIELEETREAGGALLARVRFDAIGKGSGAPVTLQFAHLWEFDGGCVVRYRSYDSVEKALLQSFYDAWNRDDFDGLLALLHRDVEWRSSGVFPGLEPVYRGHRQIGEWWDAVHEPFEDFTIELDAVREVEGETAALVRFRATGRESGAAVDLPFVHVVRFEDGLIRAISSHESVEKALAAARG